MPAAIRFGRAATNSSLSRTADLPPIGGFTAMGWFRVNANQTGSFFAYGSAATLENAIIYYQPTGQWAVFSSATAFSFGSTPTLGLWYHLALTVNSADNLRLYVNGVQDATAAYTANTATKFWIGDAYDAGSWLDGWGSAIKIWERVLTIDEINAELPYAMPLNRAGLHAAYPLANEWERLDSGIVIPRGALTRWADVGGLNREWTEAGTLDTDIGPPIAFAPRSRINVRSRVSSAIMRRFILDIPLLPLARGPAIAGVVRVGRSPVRSAITAAIKPATIVSALHPLARGPALAAMARSRRHALRSAITAGPNHVTILSALRPIARVAATAAFVRSTRPAVRSAITAGPKPVTIRAGMRLAQLWVGRATAFRPATTVPVIAGRTIRVLGGRQLTPRPRILVIARPQAGQAPLPTGAPRVTFRGAQVVNRGATGRLIQATPRRNITAGAARPTTRTTLPPTRIVAGGFRLFSPRIGIAAAVTTIRPVVIRGGAPNPKPFAGSVRITRPASAAPPSRHVTIRLGAAVTPRAIPGRVRFTGPASAPIAARHVVSMIGLAAARTRVLTPAPRIAGPRRGIITGKPRTTFVAAPLVARSLRTTVRTFHPAPAVVSIYHMAKSPTAVIVPASATSVVPAPSVTSVTVPASATSVRYPGD